MARSFVSASSQYMENATTLTNFITNTTGSFSARVYITGTASTAANARSLPCIINDSSSNMGMSRGSIGGLDRVWVWNWDGNEDRTAATFTADTWHQFGWMHSGGSLSIYKDGAVASSIVSGNTAGSGATMRAGYGYTGGNHLDGRLAEMAFWNVALDDNEWGALGDGVSPELIRPASLTAYWPILGYSSPELSRVLSSTEWTLSGSPADVEHPRVVYPSRHKIFIPGAGGGGGPAIPGPSGMFPISIELCGILSELEG